MSVSVEVVALMMRIDIAFASVRLGDGIGVHEAARIEMEEKPSSIAEGRRLDRRVWSSWKEIDERYIESFPMMMYYMDPDGRRWVLPAFLRFALMHYEVGATAIDVLLDILQKERIGVDGWDLLTVGQKNVIAKTLLFLARSQSDKIDTQAAYNAYENIWKRYDTK